MKFSNFEPKCKYCNSILEYINDHIPWGNFYKCFQHSKEVNFYYEKDLYASNIFLYKIELFGDNKYKFLLYKNMMYLVNYSTYIKRFDFVDNFITPENINNKIKTYLTFL